MHSDLIAVIEQALQPVAHLFAMRVASQHEEKQYAEVRFVNDTTGLIAAIDWGELRPFLRLARLREGSFPTTPPLEHIPARSERHVFDADDLIALRANGPTPLGKLFAAREPAAARILLEEYAGALLAYCADVLGGDFHVFTKLNEVVNDRVKQFYGAS